MNEWASALESAGGERLRAELRRLVGGAEVIEDILQDTSERFLRHSGGGIRQPGAWVRTVAVRLALSHLRRKRRHAEVGLPEEAPELATAATVVESEAESLEFEERFAAAMRQLLPEQVSLIELHYVRGMTVEEIAVLWSKSGAAVEQRLTRVRNRLRAMLTPTQPGRS
jgi:RNA polymerase sigma-70 factor, ECF subfamily